MTLNTENHSLRSQFVTLNEGTKLKSQIVTSSHGGVRYLPYDFTENGIAMLSSVLRSPTAIQVNIRIMCAFTAMRHFIASNAQIFQRLDIMKQNQLLPEHIDKIVETYHTRAEIERFSRRVKLTEIRDNDYNLNITRYVSLAQEEEQIDLDANHDKIKQIDGKISDAKTTLNGFLKELGLPEF